MKGMYRYSGDVPGRGTSDGQRVLRKWLDGFSQHKVLFEKKKFYPSIDNDELKRCFERKVKDKKG